MADTTRGTTLGKAIDVCIRPDDESAASLGELFADDVSVWSPNLLAVGIDQLAEHLDYREGAFSDVEVEISAVDTFGNKGFMEFRVSGTFSGAFALDADEFVEPNGKRLLIGAAAVAEFEGEKIKALRVYFDDATLIEQMAAA